MDFTTRFNTNLEEAPEWAKKQYVEPLKELGFDFNGFGVYDCGEDAVVNVLRFDYEHETSEELEKVLDRMKEIAEQDDDGQPHGMWRMYFGHLWIMVLGYA